MPMSAQRISLRSSPWMACGKDHATGYPWTPDPGAESMAVVSYGPRSHAGGVRRHRRARLGVLVAALADLYGIERELGHGGSHRLSRAGPRARRSAASSSDLPS